MVSEYVARESDPMGDDAGEMADPFPVSTEEEEPMPHPQAVYGYWPKKVAQLEHGDSIVLYNRSQITRLTDEAREQHGFRVRRRMLVKTERYPHDRWRCWVYDPKRWGRELD